LLIKNVPPIIPKSLEIVLPLGRCSRIFTKPMIFGKVKLMKMTKMFARNERESADFTPFALPLLKFFLVGIFAMVAGQVHAQTTLSGYQVITGQLSVATSAAPGHQLDLGSSYVNSDGSALFRKLLMVGGAVAVDFSGTASPTTDPQICFSRGLFIDAKATTDNLALRRDGELWRLGPASGTGDAILFGIYSDTYRASVMSLTNYGSIQAIRGTARGLESLAAINGMARGNKSVAIGEGAVAQSFHSFVIGRNNVVNGTGSSWIANEPLFVIGNGTGDRMDPPAVRNRDAFTVYKDGRVRIAKRQGDIMMGDFGNPE
jgi:hypothetical protein